MSTVLRIKLMEREKSGNPIKVGVIGAGLFGSLTVSQLTKIPGINVSIISDILMEKAILAYEKAGYKDGEIVQVNDPDKANRYIEKKIPVITDNNQVLIESAVDVILEATGNLEAGAKNAYNAIQNRKNIVMATVETDVTVGPILEKMAEESDVVYSMAYGDQPALIVELYDWAISSGFKVVAAGEGTAARLEWRHATPDDALQRFGFSQREIERLRLNPKIHNTFLDTTKCAVEMVAVCNATGLKPDVRGMHFSLGGIRDVPKLLSLRKDGGILENEGIVDVITRVRRDGRKIRNDIRWGVFVVVTTEDQNVMNLLKTGWGGCPIGGKGKNVLVFRPYHWAGLEASISLIRAALYKEPTGAPLPQAPAAEVVAAAKKTLKPGDILDGEGGYTAYGLAEKAEIAREENLIPFGLAENIRVKRKISRDCVITYDDVELDERSFLLKLRRMQDSIFN
jgi:predicted homoserine dehydrogenase-like protein